MSSSPATAIFLHLVSKLKENGKRVIGLGMKESSSNLLIDNCDEFIYYEDLERPVGTPPEDRAGSARTEEGGLPASGRFGGALVRENKEVLWSSLVKETMKRKKPSFNESYHGYRTFSDLLEDAQKEGIVRLQNDPRSGTYVIAGFGKDEKKGVEEKPKERKTQKSRWRARPRRPKTQAVVSATSATAPSETAPPVEPVAPNPETSEPGQEEM